LSSPKHAAPAFETPPPPQRTSVIPSRRTNFRQNPAKMPGVMMRTKEQTTPLIESVPFYVSD
jgi:hypothetical protein